MATTSAISFADTCTRFADEPENIPGTYLFPHTLKAYSDKLKEETARLFDKSKHVLDFWQIPYGGNGRCKLRDRIKVLAWYTLD